MNFSPKYPDLWDNAINMLSSDNAIIWEKADKVPNKLVKELFTGLATSVIILEELYSSPELLGEPEKEEIETKLLTFYYLLFSLDTITKVKNMTGEEIQDIYIHTPSRSNNMSEDTPQALPPEKQPELGGDDGIDHSKEPVNEPIAPLPDPIGLTPRPVPPTITTGNLKSTGVKWTWVLAGALLILVVGILLS